ncbi:MAG: DNA-3-methyladenine glycosylase I [Alcaligenaceae bacterium]|nr:DNA-3-methyladenine glycosylase I [Alcaligenaceae bacterium]
MKQCRTTMSDKRRCSWVNLNNPRSIQYHDEEWGVPVFDDRLLFEMLVLESAQAGLSWDTILNKRDNYRIALDGFDPIKVSNYDEQKIQSLLKNKGIIRHRLKIESAIHNAKVFLNIQSEYGSFSQYLWAFVNHKTIHHHHTDYAYSPTKTTLSDKISQDLKRRGMTFMGSTTLYAFMQAVGLVNDHQMTCFLYHKNGDGDNSWI